MRNIICKECGLKLPPSINSEDAAMGFHRRVVDIIARKPDDHTVSVYAGDSMDKLKLEKTIQVPSLVCDCCGRDIADGEPCKAVTMWRGPVPPEIWETAYNMPIFHESKR